MEQPVSQAQVGAAVQEAVRRVFYDGLVGGKSAFVPGLEAWMERADADLRARFADGPDGSSDTSLVKLRRQLEGAPDETAVLAADRLYVNMAPLPPEQIGVAKEREILAEALFWASREVTSPPVLGPALERFINGSQGLLNYHWAQFKVLVLLVECLAGLPAAANNSPAPGPGGPTRSPP